MPFFRATPGIAVLLISLSPYAIGQKDAKPNARTAQSSVRLVSNSEGRLVPRTESVRFTTTGYGPWKLYEERFVTMDDGGNCCYTGMTVKAFDLRASGVPVWRWTIERRGDTGEVVDPFYRIHLDGCSGDSDTNAYFNLSSGKQIYESIQPLLTVRVYSANKFDRYIAVLNDRSPGYALGEDISRLDYGSDTRTLQRLVFRFPEHSLESAMLRAPKQDSEGEIELNGAGQPESPALLSGFSIELNFWENVTVVLPVENDRIAFEKAPLPEGLKIEEVAADKDLDRRK